MRNERPACLVDTNILIYAYDPEEPAKQLRARCVLAELARGWAGSLSIQVLGEFFNVVTRKLDPPLSRDVAAEAVEDYLASWPVLHLHRDVLITAVRGSARHKLAYYDALIWATAKENSIPFILSEDFEDGRTIEGVLFRDPLPEDFDLTTLG